MNPIRGGSNIQYIPVDPIGREQDRRGLAQQEAAQNRRPSPCFEIVFINTYHVTFPNPNPRDLPFKATITGLDKINRSVKIEDENGDDLRLEVKEAIGQDLQIEDKVQIASAQLRRNSRVLEYTMKKVIDVVHTSGGIHFTPADR